MALGMDADAGMQHMGCSTQELQLLLSTAHPLVLWGSHPPAFCHPMGLLGHRSVPAASSVPDATLHKVPLIQCCFSGCGSGWAEGFRNIPLWQLSVSTDRPSWEERKQVAEAEVRAPHSTTLGSSALLGDQSNGGVGGKCSIQAG